jgi:hypothetical protein
MYIQVFPEEVTVRQKQTLCKLNQKTRLGYLITRAQNDSLENTFNMLN